jgi:hypothetical protein
MDYAKLCREISDLDPKIRFAGVCDDTGEIKYGGQRWPDGAYVILYLLRQAEEDMPWPNMRR